MAVPQLSDILPLLLQLLEYPCTKFLEMLHNLSPASIPQNIGRGSVDYDLFNAQKCVVIDYGSGSNKDNIWNVSSSSLAAVTCVLLPVMWSQIINWDCFWQSKSPILVLGSKVRFNCLSRAREIRVHHCRKIRQIACKVHFNLSARNEPRTCVFDSWLPAKNSV